MAILVSVMLFLLISVAASAVAFKLYVRPKEAIERVIGRDNPVFTAQMPHPSLAMHELIKKLGDFVPLSPKDLTLMQKRLVRGGIRNPNAIKLLYGAKVALAVGFCLITLVAMANYDTDIGNKVVVVAVGTFAGYLAPNGYVRRKVEHRQHEISRGLPNALDLMVVCVESGLGLDQAILQVAKELSEAHPEISEEFGFVNLELKAGARRAEALHNLGTRAGVEDLKKLVAVLIQADRFGTSIAQSLRAHADYMRIQARQIAEEKAAKVGVKLIFPIFFCILPSLFVVTVGPVIVKIMRELIPMMNNL